MRLNDPLTTYFDYEGKRYSINLAFDNVLDAFDYVEDNTLYDYEKAYLCLALLIGEQEYEDAIDLWNYIYDNVISKNEKEPIKYDLSGNPMPSTGKKESKKDTDFNKDASYIYASFKQAYNINLFHEQGKMHWYEFRALFHGLPTDTVMQSIIQIRRWKPSKEDSAERKKQMRELQEVYAIDDKTSEGVDE